MDHAGDLGGRPVTGSRPYELVCYECGEHTPAVSGPAGEIDLDEPLACGHAPLRVDVVMPRAASPFYER